MISDLNVAGMLEPYQTQIIGQTDGFPDRNAGSDSIQVIRSRKRQ